MKIYLASDHAGFTLKEALKLGLSKEYEVIDLGPDKYDSGDDYPDLVAPAALAVSENPENRAIIIGKSGEGEAMVANRFKNVRAAVYYGTPKDIIRLSREHNDANVLSLGAGFLSEQEAVEAARTWLQTPFAADVRHVRRLKKLASL
jgi:ribose 5-phosphate isomerase B